MHYVLCIFVCISFYASFFMRYFPQTVRQTDWLTLPGQFYLSAHLSKNIIQCNIFFKTLNLALLFFLLRQIEICLKSTYWKDYQKCILKRLPKVHIKKQTLNCTSYPTTYQQSYASHPILLRLLAFYTQTSSGLWSVIIVLIRH